MHVCTHSQTHTYTHIHTHAMNTQTDTQAQTMNTQVHTVVWLQDTFQVKSYHKASYCNMPYRLTVIDICL